MEFTPFSQKVFVDSRELEPGGVFVALKGEKTDGHFFVEEALKKGSSYVIVKEGFAKYRSDRRVIQVQDPFQTLKNWAKKTLQKIQPFVVGITGSMGKTTTKNFLKTLLEKKYKVYASPKNYNSQIGLPLTILQAEKPYDVGIFEMGMTKKGHIEKLVKIAPPDLALINNVSYVHIENFVNLEGIWEAKSEIFSSKKTKIKLIHESLLCYTKDPSVETFSTKKVPYPLPFHEEHFVWDFMAARAIALKMGLSDEEIFERLPFLKRPSMRFEKIEKMGALWINDAYNSSIVSAEYALKSLPSLGGRKLAFLGPMVELGDFSKKLHEELGEKAVDHVDILFSFGEEGKWLVDRFVKSGKKGRHFSTKEAFYEAAMNEVKKNDVVLVKASRFYALEKLFPFLS